VDILLAISSIRYGCLDTLALQATRQPYMLVLQAIRQP